MNRRVPRDDGVATVWVASLLLLVVTATVLTVGGVSATTARHAAQLAADLTALAGAGRIGVDDAAACATAGRVAAANEAVLRSCAVESTGPRTGEIRVEVARPQRWAGFALDARARARAARVPPATAVPAAVPTAAPAAVPTGVTARVGPQRRRAGSHGSPRSVTAPVHALGASQGRVWQHDPRGGAGVV